MDEYVEPIDQNKPVPELDSKTPREILQAGLLLVYTEQRILRVQGDPYTSKTNLQQFKDHYGANPIVVAIIWDELQTTTIAEARIKVLKLDSFLEALNFLIIWEKQKKPLKFMSKL